MISFHDSVERLVWSLCTDESMYTESYQQFLGQYGGPIQLKVGFKGNLRFVVNCFLFEEIQWVEY